MKKEGFDYLKGITAVDYNDHLQVVYILFNSETKKQQTLEVNLKDELSVHTAVILYQSADWPERELSEMFGIKILGREAPRLLLEKWNGVDPPLRKSFVWGKDYKRQEP